MASSPDAEFPAEQKKILMRKLNFISEEHREYLLKTYDLPGISLRINRYLSMARKEKTMIQHGEQCQVVYDQLRIGFDHDLHSIISKLLCFVLFVFNMRELLEAASVAVLHYFDKKLPVKVYIFRKAAFSALQKMHTFTGDIRIIWGMIRRTANLKNMSGELFLNWLWLVEICPWRVLDNVFIGTENLEIFRELIKVMGILQKVKDSVESCFDVAFFSKRSYDSDKS